MSLPFPEPTVDRESPTEVYLGYLDYFRSCVVSRLRGLPEAEVRGSRLPSGWTPIQLLKHLTFVELRWFEWGFAGLDVAEPWGDRGDGQRDSRWYVGPDESLDELVLAFQAQADRTRAVVEANDLAARGQPGSRWDGEQPATLERVLLHVLQEYARHVGHLDIVSELAGGPVGE